MITKRQFLEVVCDRLSGGPAFADTKDNYPLPLIARFVDMAIPQILNADPYSLSEMSIPRTFTPASDDNGHYVTMNPAPAAGIIAITEIYDEKGDFYIQDKSTSAAFKILRGSNKNGAVLFANKLRLNRTPEGSVSVTYVPLISQMSDNDQIILADGELPLYDVIVRGVMMLDRMKADKTNNDLTDPV